MLEKSIDYIWENDKCLKVTDDFEVFSFHSKGGNGID